MTDLETRFEEAFSQCPLIAILRGITSHEVVDVGEALVEAGLRLIEIPLNSPSALDSVARLAAKLDNKALVGAGTVLSVDQVRAVGAAGGSLVVSPNANPAVIAEARALGLIALPGYFTPTEALTAIAAGAHGLKLFPANTVEPALLTAQRAILPSDLKIVVVGGVKPNTLQAWLAAGANGFGLGANLYRPGKSAEAVGETASQFVAALQFAQQSLPLGV